MGGPGSAGFSPGVELALACLPAALRTVARAREGREDDFPVLRRTLALSEEIAIGLRRPSSESSWLPIGATAGSLGQDEEP